MTEATTTPTAAPEMQVAQIKTVKPSGVAITTTLEIPMQNLRAAGELILAGADPLQTIGQILATMRVRSVAMELDQPMPVAQVQGIVPASAMPRLALPRR